MPEPYRAGVPALMSLLDSSSDELAGAGAAALGALGDTSLLPSLFGRALFASGQIDQLIVKGNSDVRGNRAHLPGVW